MFISKRTIEKKLDQIDVTKSREPNGLLRGFFRKTSGKISKIQKKLSRSIKRLGKIPEIGKTAAVTPIHKKGEVLKIGNYRPVSLLDIGSKIFEKLIYLGLWNHFVFYLTEHQHGFVNHRSVIANIMIFSKSYMKRWTTTQTSKLWPSPLTSLKPVIKCFIRNSPKRSPKLR